MKKKLILIVLFCIIVLIAFTTWVIYDYVEVGYSSICKPTIIFDENEENNTLTVAKIDMCDIPKSDFVWENTDMPYGNGTRPTGEIKIGDIVTNCSSNGCIRWIPINSLLCSWDFEK